MTIAMTPTAVSKIASPTGGPGQELPFEDPSGDDQRQALEERERVANGVSTKMHFCDSVACVGLGAHLARGLHSKLRRLAVVAQAAARAL